MTHLTLTGETCRYKDEFHDGSCVTVEAYEAQLEANRQHHARAREAVFGHYGRTCVCCGASKWLTIDHIDGDGKAHRASLEIQAGHQFYLWLIREDFPEGFQTLCTTCNSSKSTHGACGLKHSPGDTRTGRPWVGDGRLLAGDLVPPRGRRRHPGQGGGQVTDSSDLAMYHAVEKHQGQLMSITGALLVGMLKHSAPGVTLHVDWPLYLGVTREELLDTLTGYFSENVAGRLFKEIQRCDTPGSKAIAEVIPAYQSSDEFRAWARTQAEQTLAAYSSPQPG